MRNFKTLISSLLVLIICLSVMSFQPIGVKAWGETFIIDAGHGGYDPGACAYGRAESADVLNLSFRVGQIISTVNSVTYTRTDDTFISLQGRCDIANSNGNAFFCSIHRNAGGGTGVETYHSKNASSASVTMAHEVNNRLASCAPWGNNRGVKSANYTVISRTNMPAILVEVGFIDTAADNVVFDQYFEQIAYAIANGLLAMTGQYVDPSSGGYVEPWQAAVAFDPVVYRGRYEDLKEMNDEQLKEHWLNNGIKEGRASSTVLDLQYYLDNNPDLKAEYGTDYEAAYFHFVTLGYKERRKSSPLFDGGYYCDNNPDVVAAHGDEYILHYIFYGLAEGRRASETFDVNYYLHIRGDVASIWPGDYVKAAQHYAGNGIKEGTPGYDSEKPVISNVVISNVTAEGYTVSCTVNDNWGVDKVMFPTWTVKNDQDDLREDWSNSAVGVRNGNTFTYNVKVSDHNNEKGLYTTHIYAFDFAGNLAGLALDNVVVQDYEEEIKLVPSSKYVKDGALLKNVSTSTTASELLSQFENKYLKVVDAKGNEIPSSEIVGTGAKILLYAGDVVLDSLNVVILGDVDGNGIIDSTDYIRVKSAFLGSFTFDEIQSVSADVDGNVSIDSTDYIRIKSHFLGNFAV